MAGNWTSWRDYGAGAEKRGEHLTMVDAYRLCSDSHQLFDPAVATAWIENAVTGEIHECRDGQWQTTRRPRPAPARARPPGDQPRSADPEAPNFRRDIHG
jgi:hypothetical protein